MQAKLQTIHPALVLKDSYQILMKYTMADAEVAEGVITGRGYGVEWEEREKFNTGNRLLLYAFFAQINRCIHHCRCFCTKNGLTRGGTNHNCRKRVTYLNCNQDGCHAKFRVIKNLNTNIYQLKMGVGCDHNHNFLQAPERGMTQEQKVKLKNFICGTSIYFSTVSNISM